MSVAAGHATFWNLAGHALAGVVRHGRVREVDHDAEEVLGPRLHVKIGNRITEEYGRQSLLLNAASTGEPARTLVLDLPAPESIRGVYVMDATGRTPCKVSPPTVFIEAGESARRSFHRRDDKIFPTAWSR